MKLRFPNGTDSVCHGTTEYKVNNYTWTVEVPDHIGRYFLELGRAGASLAPGEPEPEIPIVISPTPIPPAH
jgi:hypothetical protein